METVFGRLLRFLLWPIIVITAVNIENWASASGYVSFLTAKIESESDFGLFLQFLMEPFITHIAAFFAGGAILAWINWWSERMEYRHGGPPRWILTGNINALAEAISKRRKKKSWVGWSYDELCEKANKALHHFNLMEVECAALDRDDARVIYLAYLRAVYHALEQKREDLCLPLSEQFERQIKSLPVVPQLPPNTESETQQ